MAKDSAIFSVQLEEICITDTADIKDESFNFYRNNKLANTEEILSRIRGVNLIKRGAYGLEPIVRNYSNGQTNVTIDGMRMYGACTDKMDPVSIYVEPSNLKSIQVAMGAAGAQEGSTIGGQISLKLREPEFLCHSKTNGSFGNSYLSVNNGFNTTFALQQSSKRLAYRINTTYRKAENYYSGNKISIPFSGYEKLNGSASIMFKVSELQIIKVDYLGDWGRNIGFPALPMDVGIANAQITSISQQLKFKKTLFTNNELKFYYNNILHQMDDTKRPESPMHMDMPGWSRTIGFYDELKSGNKLKLRLDYHQAYLRADMTMYPFQEPIMYMQTLPENNLHDLGFAATYIFKIKSNQQITMNTRLDLYKQSAVLGFGSQQWLVFSKDIRVIKVDALKNMNTSYHYRLNKKTNTQLSIGYSERIPTSNERYGFYLYNRQDQFDYLGNIHLKPEQSLQTEFLFEQKFKKIQYNINLFYHHINQYIYAYQLVGFSQMTIGAKGLKAYENIKYAINQGFEMSMKAELLKNLIYMAGVKYIYSYTHLGNPLPLVPPLKLQHALRYNKGLFMFQFEHDFAAAQNRINKDYGDVATTQYNLFNLRASKNIAIKSTILQVSIACENIFDINYREHLDIGQIPRFGRNFLINVNIIF